MIEMHILESAKETDNKLRWDASIDDTKFSLYIPKWRVPDPWPATIFVGVSDQLDRYEGYTPVSQIIAEREPNLLKRPILAVIKWVSDHTQTVRYAPDGAPKEWEIGEPYIPYTLLPKESSNPLLIEVKWDL